MGPKKHCCIGPIPFAFFFTPFYTTVLLTFWFFRNPLIIETQNLCHWIWHTLNPKYTPLKPFQCIFPIQNQQNIKFVAVCLTILTKNERHFNLHREKVLEKAWNSAHIGLCVCWSQYTMLELCVTSTFWIMMVFSWWSFIEKTSVKQSMTCKVWSNVWMSFLHLGQMDPLLQTSGGQEQCYVRSTLTFGEPLGQVDL